MSNALDPNAFLMGGGGAPSASFPDIGTVWKGRITEQPQVQQQRDAQTKELKFWADGNPMMQLVVTIQTDKRDATIQDDDGKRRLFIKSQMLQAVRDAVQAAGAPGLAVGGTLGVKYTGDGERKKGALSAPKVYKASYEPPTTSVDLDDEEPF